MCNTALFLHLHARTQFVRSLRSFPNSANSCTRHFTWYLQHIFFDAVQGFLWDFDRAKKIPTRKCFSPTNSTHWSLRRGSDEKHNGSRHTCQLKKEECQPFRIGGTSFLFWHVMGDFPFWPLPLVPLGPLWPLVNVGEKHFTTFPWDNPIPNFNGCCSLIFPIFGCH